MINVPGCPLLWKPQFQSETAMRTMESYVIALAACFRELIPIIAVVDEVGAAVGLTQSNNSKILLCIHEENTVLLVLDQTLPPQFTPASKQLCGKNALV